jgi:hypothetical protein
MRPAASLPDFLCLDIRPVSLAGRFGYELSSQHGAELSYPQSGRGKVFLKEWLEFPSKQKTARDERQRRGEMNRPELHLALRTSPQNPGPNEDWLNKTRETILQNIKLDQRSTGL